MKTWVKISFPENRNLKNIVIKGGFELKGTTLMIDVDKKANESQTCLADMEYHYIRDVKLISINASSQPFLWNEYQTIILEGYYRKNSGFVLCHIEYKINNLDE